MIAPATPFNKNIGPHRRWAFTSVALADVKSIKNAAGVTVNDVVMALCAGALRVWLQKHDALPEGPLVAAVQVSIRTEEQKGTHGNRVSSVIASLPTHLADPLRGWQLCMRRWARRRISTTRCPPICSPTSRNFPCRRWPTRPTDWQPDSGCGKGYRRSTGSSANVPGRQWISNGVGHGWTAYTAAIADGQGLNLTVLGSNGKLNFGALADRDLVPDVDLIIDALNDERAGVAP